MKQTRHNIPITRWGNDGTKPCPRPNVNWRHLPRADGKWRMERGCAWCGWTEPERLIDTVIMLEEKKESN